MVLKKGKKDSNTLFVDATNECIKITNNNKLAPENLDNIVAEYTSREDKAHFARLVSYDEIKENNYNLAVATYIEAVHAFKAFQKAFIAEGKEVKYLISGEMGGFNTFTPMLVALLSDKDPEKRIKFVDVDCNGRACPELNTTLTAYWNHPPKPMGLGSLYGDEIAVYPISDQSGEQIARQMCMLYGMRIGFATWGMNKAEMAEALDIGCVTKAQKIGKAILTAKANGTDLMDELKKVMEVREFCRGTIEKLDIKAEGGFDFGTTVVKDDKGSKYYIDFKNENLILRDEAGNTVLTAPDGIGMVDMDTLMPLTNADTKVGMKVLVTMTPAHPNWWDAERKPNECWLPELRKVGMKGDQVRY